MAKTGSDERNRLTLLHLYLLSSLRAKLVLIVRSPKAWQMGNIPRKVLLIFIPTPDMIDGGWCFYIPLSRARENWIG